jgi:acetyl-CoA acetyltransferase
VRERSVAEIDAVSTITRECRRQKDRIDVAELHAPYTHQELLLRQAMGLSESTHINPSGGALVANPAMAAGLARFAEAAESVFSGSADRVLAHCTSGPLLQQNLVCVMEGE